MTRVEAPRATGHCLAVPDVIILCTLSERSRALANGYMHMRVRGRRDKRRAREYVTRYLRRRSQRLGDDEIQTLRLCFFYNFAKR